MPEEAADLAKLSGMLREAAHGKGNFSLGTTTGVEADAIGRAWVGEGVHGGKRWPDACQSGPLAAISASKL